MDKPRGAVGGSACAVPANMEGPGFHPLEAGQREATWGYGVQPEPEADLATSHWSWRSCWRSPGLRCATIKRRRSWRKNRPRQPRASLKADLARWLRDIPPTVVDPGGFLMEKGLPTGPSHLAENVLLPVAELEGKESVPGRPHCSSITLFSPRKPVQPTLVLGLWAGPPPLWGSPLPIVGC